MLVFETDLLLVTVSESGEDSQVAAWGINLITSPKAVSLKICQNHPKGLKNNNTDLWVLPPENLHF